MAKRIFSVPHRDALVYTSLRSRANRQPNNLRPHTNPSPIPDRSMNPLIIVRVFVKDRRRRRRRRRQEDIVVFVREDAFLRRRLLLLLLLLR